MDSDDTSRTSAAPGGIIRPLLTAAAALGLFDAGVTCLGHGYGLTSYQFAVLAAGAFLLPFGAAVGAAGPVLVAARKIAGPARFDEVLGGPWRWLADWLLEPETLASAASLHRSWRWALGIALALGALGLVAWLGLTTFREPFRTAVFIAGVGLPAAMLARAAGRAVWDRLVADPSRDGGRWPALVVRAGAAILWLPLPIVAVLLLIRRDEVFGAIDPWPHAGLAVFVAVLGATSAFASRRSATRVHRAGVTGAGAALAGIVFGAWMLSGPAPVQLALQRGSGLSRVLYSAAMELLDMDRDGHPWLLGGDCRPFDPNVHPLAEEIPGSGRDENCDGVDGPPALSASEDPLRRMAAAGPASGNGILLVIIDSARSENLSLHGYHRPTSPNLDRFASGAAVFDAFFAVGNHTALSMPAIMTGRYPSSRPDAREINWHAVPVAPAEGPVPIRLRDRGWKAVFVPGHFMRSFLTGFDVRLPRGKGHEAARRTAARAVEIMRRAGPEARMLLGVHFMGPHHPYRAPERPKRFGERPMDRFDAELAHVDEALAPLLELMQQPGFDRWLVLVTGDHGEAFGEHGTPYHGHTLHDEEVRVPLVLRVPGAPARREPTPAGHLDLAPTMIHFATGEVPAELAGASLLPLTVRDPDDPPLERLVFSESFRRGDMFAVRDGARTMILHPRPWLFELYDSEADPAHRRNLYRAGAAADLRAALVDHARRSTAALGGDPAR